MCWNYWSWWICSCFPEAVALQYELMRLYIGSEVKKLQTCTITIELTNNYARRKKFSFPVTDMYKLKASDPCIMPAYTFRNILGSLTSGDLAFLKCQHAGLRPFCCASMLPSMRLVLRGACIETWKLCGGIFWLTRTMSLSLIGQFQVNYCNWLDGRLVIITADWLIFRTWLLFPLM